MLRKQLRLGGFELLKPFVGLFLSCVRTLWLGLGGDAAMVARSHGASGLPGAVTVPPLPFGILGCVGRVFVGNCSIQALRLLVKGEFCLLVYFKQLVFTGMEGSGRCHNQLLSLLMPHYLQPVPSVGHGSAPYTLTSSIPQPALLLRAKILPPRAVSG